MAIAYHIVVSVVAFFMLKVVYARLYKLENIIESMEGRLSKQAVELEVVRSKQIMNAPLPKAAHPKHKKN